MRREYGRRSRTRSGRGYECKYDDGFGRRGYSRSRQQLRRYADYDEYDDEYYDSPTLTERIAGALSQRKEKKEKKEAVVCNNLQFDSAVTCGSYTNAATGEEVDFD